MILRQKCVFFVLVFAVVAGGVFAQSENTQGENIQNDNAKNWITGEFGLLGNGIRYDRMLSGKWSLGGTAFWNTFLSVSLGAEAVGRFYPWAASFYLELGLGYGLLSGFNAASGDGNLLHGFLIAPGLGWRIDVGRPGGFFINPSITVPVIVGTPIYTYVYSVDNGEWGIGISVKPFFGMGYAF